MGEQTCQVGSVSRAFLFFFSLIAKMTLKTQKFQKNLTLFAEKFWKNILTYFQKLFQLKCFDFGKKMADFTRFWGKKSVKTENLGRSRP